MTNKENTRWDYEKLNSYVDKSNIRAGRKQFEIPEFIEAEWYLPWNEQYDHHNWKTYKSAILTRDSHMCRRCKNPNTRLHVHHKKYYGAYVWSVAPEDLISLCEPCHRIVHLQKPIKKNKLPKPKLKQQ